MSLNEFLQQTLLSGAAVGAFVFAVFEYLNIAANMDMKWKRLLVAGVSTVISLLVWGLVLWLGYAPLPETRQAVAESIWLYGVGTALAAFGTSTIVHGFAKK